MGARVRQSPQVRVRVYQSQQVRARVCLSLLEEGVCVREGSRVWKGVEYLSQDFFNVFNLGWQMLVAAKTRNRPEPEPSFQLKPHTRTASLTGWVRSRPYRVRKNCHPYLEHPWIIKKLQGNL